ncbi:MAG: exodeoxyribonuclease subunit beta, partial [Pseudomonadota bacterium]
HGGPHAYGRPLTPSEILVMTFTRAATRELSDRIRARLLEAARMFRGEALPQATDTLMSTLLAAYPEGEARKTAAWRLANAAESMDDAAVLTIDAWCQRMLREHAFDSGNLFDETLLADEALLQTQAALDYWRVACYPLGQDELRVVLQVWKSATALVADMRGLRGKALDAAPEGWTLQQVLAQALQARSQAVAQLKVGWADKAQAMRQWLDDQLARKDKSWIGTKLQARHYTSWLTTLREWALGQNTADIPDLKKGWERLTPEGLYDARKPDAAPLALPAMFAELAALKSALEELPKVVVALRSHAAANVAQRLRLLKQRSATFGFADMLQRLNTALAGDHGKGLRERIRSQYPVVLIDEFQDTSPVQLNIFDQIYGVAHNDPQTALMLIGDPKQSIYGFRGADIDSYLRARRHTAGRHYVLGTNYRSTHDVVNAVNHVWARAEKAWDSGAFLYKSGSEQPLPFLPVAAQGREEALLRGASPIPALTLVHDGQIDKVGAMRRRSAARCAEQIVAWLNDPQTGFVTPGQAEQRLRPADIAVLVRTGKEAALVRQALGRRGVASVYLSDKDSVFQSEEALDLLHWLRGVAQPQDVRLVRAALATGTLGLSLSTLKQMANDDALLDSYAVRLLDLHQVWQSQGVLAMLRHTLHLWELPSRWLAEPQGERRLTNVLHLAELLQSASSALEGEQALIRWLANQLQDPQGQGDEHILRLESDAGLVKVVTIHSSKGLEYAVVCLPFATGFRTLEPRKLGAIELADEQGQRRTLLHFSDQELAQADRNRLREDLRLLYVALTRARHALWVVFAAQKVGSSDRCATQLGAAGYLVGGSEEREVDDWREQLRSLVAGQAGMLLEEAGPITCTLLNRPEAERPLQAERIYSHKLDQSWTIASFSKLSKGVSERAVPLSLGTHRPADDEVQPGADASPYPVPTPPIPGDPPRADWHAMARGPAAGNFLHDQLEWLAAEGFALADNPDLAERLRRRTSRHAPNMDADGVVQWLQAVVSTRMPGVEAALCELGAVLPEMEFWLPAHSLDTPAIDAICASHILPGLERPALPASQLHGMLMGFADLVFEHQGRYWVLDYKSNHLGPDDAAYHRDALDHAMLAHRYDVQAALYMLALHRLLRSRLGSAYLPEQHLGGAIYFFLRGVRGPCAGVCHIAAGMPMLDGLDQMLLHQGEGA